jgi:alpha-tubulin suppressor-like RCC1 family protein
MGSNSHG